MHKSDELQAILSKWCAIEVAVGAIEDQLLTECALVSDDATQNVQHRYNEARHSLENAVHLSRNEIGIILRSDVPRFPRGDPGRIEEWTDGVRKHVSAVKANIQRLLPETGSMQDTSSHSVTTSSEEPATHALFCCQCKRETEHADVASHTLHYETEGQEGETSYSVMRCSLCGDMSFQIWSMWPLGSDPDIEIYPERRAQITPNAVLIEKIQKRSQSPIDKWAILDKIYREVIKSLNGGMDILFIMGVRCLLDRFVPGTGMLGPKLEAARAHGLFTEDDYLVLQEIKKYGNDGAHGGEHLPLSKGKEVIEVVETYLLYQILREDFATRNEIRRSPPNQRTPRLSG